MVLKLKKRRHKPLYKNFIPLKKNIQNRRRLNLLKFKKQKWEKLISYLKRLQTRRKKNFRMYDINRYFLPKFYNSFKRKYKNITQTNKKFKLFYGGLLSKYVKKQIGLLLKQKNVLLRNSVNLNSFFISLFEKRLDTILYRAHFAVSIRLARQLISHRHVKVNNVIVKESSTILQKGDFIEIVNSGSKIVESSIQSSHIWPIPPKYLNINYKTLQILYHGSIKSQNISTFFPFWVDVNTIMRYKR